MNFMAFNLIDWIFLAILIGFIFSAMKKGLIKSFFGVFSFFVSVLLSSQFYPKVADFIKNKTPFYNWFCSMLNDTLNLSEMIRSQAGNIQSGLQNNLMDNVQNSTGISKELLSNIELPNFIKDNFLAANTSQIVKIFDISALEKYISNNLADILVNILAMVITFSLVSLAIGIISHVLDIISFFPIIHGANKIGGAIVGLAEGAICLWVICMVISLVIENKDFAFLKKEISTSVLAIKFYESNWILKFLSQFIPSLK